MMRRHFAIPEGCRHVALERDVRQSGRGGHFFNWEALPPHSMIIVPENNGRSLSYCYLVVPGNNMATNSNKVTALAAAVTALAEEKAAATSTKIATTMTTNVTEVFMANANSAIMLEAFNANQHLRLQQQNEQQRARDLALSMNNSGLTDFLEEEEEKTREKRARRQGVE